MSPASQPAQGEARFGTNLVWIEIAALAALIAFMPSPALLIGGLMIVWGTACWIGHYTSGENPGTDANAAAEHL